MSPIRVQRLRPQPRASERRLRLWRGARILLVACVLTLSACKRPADDASTTDDRRDAATAPAVPPDATPAPSIPALTRGTAQWRSFDSALGYTIRVAPDIAMGPEEPCCDVATSRADGQHFMRIERIDGAGDLATLRENMVLALTSAGEPVPLPADQTPAGALHDIALAMRAPGDTVDVTMLIASIDSGRYRITLHLPHATDDDATAIAFWSMLSTLRTTGPLTRT